MSADDAIFIRLNKQGEFVAQHGSMSADELPDVENAPISRRFGTLQSLVAQLLPEANDTEYGFKFLFDAVQLERIEKPRATLGVEKIREKPRECEAVQYDGTRAQAYEIIAWLDRVGFTAQLIDGYDVQGPDTIQVDALTNPVVPGQWLVYCEDSIAVMHQNDLERRYIFTNPRERG